jgi:hypothetical protein
MTGVYSSSGAARCLRRLAAGNTSTYAERKPKEINMKAIKVLSIVMSLALMTMFGASGSWAQDKAKDAKAAPAAKPGKEPTIKILLENEKVRVQEVTYKPGDENTAVSRDGRVVRALTAGTLQRTYTDGKTDKVEWKVGETRYNEPAPGSAPQYKAKSVGKSDLVLYVVIVKGTSQPAPAKK